jgi:hypothetical protein
VRREQTGGKFGMAVMICRTQSERLTPRQAVGSDALHAAEPAWAES